MGLGIYLPSPPAKLLAYFKSGALASIDPNTVAQGDAQPKSDADAFFKGFDLKFKQSDEVKGLLNAAANDRFNLSTDEIQSFASLKKLAAADNTALVAGVTQHYREILLRRWQSYRKGGLSGIAPYARHAGKRLVLRRNSLRIATVRQQIAGALLS